MKISVPENWVQWYNPQFLQIFVKIMISLWREWGLLFSDMGLGGGMAISLGLGGDRENPCQKGDPDTGIIPEIKVPPVMILILVGFSPKYNP